jgi:hypothetical protein
VLALLAVAVAVGVVQQYSDARQAGFGAHPDEASHFMSGLMIRDYLASGSGSPIAYAENYYLFHPYFAIGVWPPLFYGIEAGWMLLFGHGRASVIVLVGLIAAANALLVFGLVRRMGTVVLALSASILLLLAPSVRWSSGVVMTDLLVSLFVLTATIAFARFVEKPSWREGTLTGLAAGLAILSKYSAAFALVPPVLLILIDRRWRLLMDVRLWAGVVVFACTAGPWAYVSRRFTAVGFAGVQPGSPTSRLRDVIFYYVSDWGWLLSAGIVVATVWAFVRWRHLSPIVKLVALQTPCLVPFLILAPPDIEGRYVMLGYPGVVVLMAAAVVGVGARYPDRRKAVVALGACGVLVFGLTKTSAYRPLPSDVGQRVARDLVASAGTGQAAILVPTHLEGPMIAELAAAEPRRPMLLLARPTKLFASNNWVGTDYVLTTPDLDALKKVFDAYPIDTILLAHVAERHDLPHDTLLRAMVQGPNSEWSRRQEYTGRGTRGPVTIEVFTRPHKGQSFAALLEFVQDQTQK